MRQTSHGSASSSATGSRRISSGISGIKDSAVHAGASDMAELGAGVDASDQRTKIAEAS
jgi:hypothetical protein